MFATKAKDVAYEKKKIREANRQRKIAAAGREIGELPPIKDPIRKELCRLNFRLFCERYFPDVFVLAWSTDHLEVIASIETTVLHGGMFALAMPRGSGKTSLCEVACIWAAVYGHHQFILLIGADADAASESLESVRTLLETNDILAEDFPEVCYPLSKLEGITQRRLLYRGKPIKIKFTKLSIILPDIPGSAASSVIFRVAGITGRVRGMKYIRRDKKPVRPTLCLCDDPQTDESAASESMTRSRVKVLTKAVRGLAGPGKKIAALMPCTVIKRNDMADQILDPMKHPAWHGRRYKLVRAWPKRMDLWEIYVQKRYDCQRAHKPTTPATNYYKQNRAAMDEGAEVAWPARFEPDELSAIQNVINLRYESPDASEEAFLCEYQNEPPEVDDGTEKLPPVEDLQSHIGPYKIRELAQEVAHVVGGIDVQTECLYWEADAFVPNYTSYLLEYNTFPPQPTAHFALRSISETLSKKYPKANLDGRIYQALTDLVEQMLKTEYRSKDGRVALRVEKIGIDSSFKTRLIHKFCRESPHSALLFPTHGRSIKATNKPLREFRIEPGEKLYHLCKLTKGNQKARLTRHLEIDTNAVKTFIFERFATFIGDSGAFQMYEGHSTRHRLYCEHLLAEFRKAVEYNGRRVEQWELLPGKPDNHWLDTRGIVMALADTLGCSLTLPTPKTKPRQARQPIEAETL